MKFILIFVCVLLSYNVDAWDNDELEIFDTVELINENFYKILAISQVSAIIQH